MPAVLQFGLCKCTFQDRYHQCSNGPRSQSTDVSNVLYSVLVNKKPAKASVFPASTDNNISRSSMTTDGFPEKLTGRILFCHQDNLNTDGIYPGKYTYIDQTAEQQASVVMENYDPEFKNIAKPGDILVAGFNFGTGSSREQAATALKYKGIPCVIAGSFSETYKRNAINNGHLAIECPELVIDLKKKFGTEKLTKVINNVGGINEKEDDLCEINFAESTIRCFEKSYAIDPIGKVAQELIVSEGLENWIRKKLQQHQQNYKLVT